jgi:hypothetical protein
LIHVYDTEKQRQHDATADRPADPNANARGLYYYAEPKEAFVPTGDAKDAERERRHAQAQAHAHAHAHAHRRLFSFRYTYIDDEEDRVTIASDLELTEALRVSSSQGTALRLELTMLMEE